MCNLLAVAVPCPGETTCSTSPVLPRFINYYCCLRTANNVFRNLLIEVTETIEQPIAIGTQLLVTTHGYLRTHHRQWSSNFVTVVLFNRHELLRTVCQ